MKYYWCLCKVRTYYEYGSTYKYVLWEISEERFFKIRYLFKITNSEKGWILYNE